MTGFSGLYTGLSALIAHRQATEVISHNIANVNTDGYNRRRVDLKTDGLGAVAAVYSRGLNTGNGVKVDGIARIRDDFLEAQFRNESATGKTLEGTTTVLSRLETAMPEPSENGINEQLNAFWASWDGVINQPENEAARQSVLSRASALVTQIQQADRQIRVVHDDAATHVSQVVDEVNNLAGQVASLNDAVKAATVAGLSPNDLLDQRDLLTSRITDLVGGRVVEGEFNSVSLYVGGRALVFGDRSEKLQAVQVADPALAAVGVDKVQVQWAIDGYPADNVGGEAAGYIEGANTLAPKYLAKLDAVASKLVSDVNAIHSTGKDLDGVTGRNFFDPAGTTATTLSLSTDVANQPRHIAAASTTGGVLDASVAEQIAGLKTSATGADVLYRSLVAGLGVEVNYYDQQDAVQTSVVQRLDQDRKNVSGVNLDEEMVNLVAAQHAYSAAARVITTVDEMLDTLINRTGRVGL